MPEGVGYVGPNIVAGTGLELNYLGSHCFAYSGSFNPGSGETYLDFTTGSGYIVGVVEINADYAGTGGTNLQVEISLNGIDVVVERDVGNDYVPGDTEFKLIIPPYTNVKVDISGSASAPANANFTGRVYK